MNVKQGDLAIVIGATLTPEMIGRVVEVVRPAVDGEIIHSSGAFVMLNGEPTWIIRGLSGDLLPCRTMGGKFIVVHERGFPDRLLRPVSGLPVEEYDRITEKEPA